MDEPLVSVVMAVWQNDRMAYLREAVESVRGQAYANLQILIVENGPVPEEIGAYLAETARQDPRIELLKLAKNIGPGGARNAAFAKARGIYTAVLDADDVAPPSRILRQVGFLQKTRADVAGSWFRLIDEHGNELGRKQVPVTSEMIRRASLFFNPIPNPTVMGRTEVLREHGYRESYRYGEDYYLWITLLRKGYTLLNQPEYLLDFRTGPDFLKKRQGWHKWRTDFANKTAALPLYSPAARPFLFLLIPLLVSTRLLPAPLLRLLYSVRNRLDFGVRKSR